MPELDLLGILTELGPLMHQFQSFITNFNATIITSNINVMVDSIGAMSLDVPKDMPDSTVEFTRKKLVLADHLINVKGSEILNLLKKGLDIKNSLGVTDSDHTSELMSKIKEFKELNNSYKPSNIKTDILN
jgi:hypothetical protein